MIFPGCIAEPKNANRKISDISEPFPFKHGMLRRIHELFRFFA